MHEHKFDDFYLLDEKTVDEKRAKQTIAMFAQQLTLGRTIYQETVRGSTVRDYCNSVAKTIINCGARKDDIRRDRPTNKTFTNVWLSHVLKDFERFQNDKRHRNDFTLEMMRYINTHVVRNTVQDNLILNAAMACLLYTSPSPRDS